MNTTLITAALPAKALSAETHLGETLQIPVRGRPSYHRDHYRKCLAYGELILKIGKSCTESILNHDYKQFDALIKNNGCQVTALQNYRLFQNPRLFKEAKMLAILIENRLSLLPYLQKNPPFGNLGDPIERYLSDCGIDCPISQNMAQCLRFRILQIVNTNRVVNSREIPHTKIENLLVYIQKGYEEKLPLNAYVGALQAEESTISVRYIQNVAQEQLQKEKNLRTEMIAYGLSDAFLRETASNRMRNLHNIISLPQAYTCEAALRAIEDGVVVVKNKLYNGDERIKEAEPYRLFIKMPTEEILTETEVREMPNSLPIIALEGYIANTKTLAASIKTHGIVTILLANAARIKQYASCNSQSPIVDQSIAQDLATYLAMQEAYEVIEMDHIYCTSIKEEIQ